jgi:hypothetical protein
MKFDDLPDKETLRLIKQLSENSSALNASRFLIDRRDSAIDRIAARAVDEYRRECNSLHRRGKWTFWAQKENKKGATF